MVLKKCARSVQAQGSNYSLINFWEAGPLGLAYLERCGDSPTKYILSFGYLEPDFSIEL